VAGAAHLALDLGELSPPLLLPPLLPHRLRHLLILGDESLRPLRLGSRVCARHQRLQSLGLLPRVLMPPHEGLRDLVHDEHAEQRHRDLGTAGAVQPVHVPPLTGAHLCSIGREQLLQRALLAAGDRAEPNALAIEALRGARLHVAVDALPQRLAPAQTERSASSPAASSNLRQLADAHHSQPAPCSSQLGLSSASGGAAAPSSPDIALAAGWRRAEEAQPTPSMRDPAPWKSSGLRELREHNLSVGPHENASSCPLAGQSPTDAGDIAQRVPVSAAERLR